MTNIDKKDPLPMTPDFPVAGPSAPLLPLTTANQLEQPPTFADHAGMSEDAPKYTERPIELVYIPPGGEEPPPEFTPYEAEYFISNKEIVSHDPHLNEDGRSLSQFCPSLVEKF